MASTSSGATGYAGARLLYEPRSDVSVREREDRSAGDEVLEHLARRLRAVARRDEQQGIGAALERQRLARGSCPTRRTACWRPRAAIARSSSGRARPASTRHSRSPSSGSRARSCASASRNGPGSRPQPPLSVPVCTRLTRPGSRSGGRAMATWGSSSGSQPLGTHAVAAPSRRSRSSAIGGVAAVAASAPSATRRSSARSRARWARVANRGRSDSKHQPSRKSATHGGRRSPSSRPRRWVDSNGEEVTTQS